MELAPGHWAAEALLPKCLFSGTVKPSQTVMDAARSDSVADCTATYTTPPQTKRTTCVIQAAYTNDCTRCCLILDSMNPTHPAA